MITPAVFGSGQLTLIVGPHAEREAMLAIVARFALRGPARVLDGGNSYDAFQVARLIRRASRDLDRALGRIAVARAFTCYQVLTLLVRLVIGHLRRLRKGGPVAVAVRPLPQAERAGLVELLMAAADEVIMREEPAVASPLTLF